MSSSIIDRYLHPHEGGLIQNMPGSKGVATGQKSRWLPGALRIKVMVGCRKGNRKQTSAARKEGSVKEVRSEENNK